MATSTPWGPSQYSTKYGFGITSYGTAGHGGFKVCATLNAKMPDCLRLNDGWYEEDCEWARVALAFPDRFSEKQIAAAKDTLRNQHPDAYEKLYGVTLQPGESHIKDQLRFIEEHKNDYIVVAAWGYPYNSVPKGMVGCFAVRGGRDSNYQYASKDEKYFLVPAEEYAKRDGNGFLIDPTRHQEIERL